MDSSSLIVLVHGALTDASIWSDVIALLQKVGVSSIAPALPLRGLRSDAEYLSAFLRTLPDSYFFVGHSYGGSVISHSLLTDDGLKGLVFVSAFIQDANETAGELNGRWPGSRLGEETTVVRPYPGGNELYLKAESFGEVYAGDLSKENIEVLSARQRPIDVAALNESFSGAPTWKTVPSWALISTEDLSIPPEAQRAMARRANARISEAAASHAVPLSVPESVVDLIRVALGEICTGA